MFELKVIPKNRQTLKLSLEKNPSTDRFYVTFSLQIWYLQRNTYSPLDYYIKDGSGRRQYVHVHNDDMSRYKS